MAPAGKGVNSGPRLTDKLLNPIVWHQNEGFHEAAPFAAKQRQPQGITVRAFTFILFSTLFRRIFFPTRPLPPTDRHKLVPAPPFPDHGARAKSAFSGVDGIGPFGGESICPRVLLPFRRPRPGKREKPQSRVTLGRRPVGKPLGSALVPKSPTDYAAGRKKQLSRRPAVPLLRQDARTVFQPAKELQPSPGDFYYFSAEGI